MGKLFKGDIGTRIILNTGEDLTTATLKEIYYEKPSGTGGKWTANVVTGQNTKIYYDTQEGDLDEKGKWLFQSYVEFADWKGFGEIATRQVYEHLEGPS